MNRREAIQKTAAGASAAAFLPLSLQTNSSEKVISSNELKGNINHSVCEWCYPDLNLEELCQVANELGLVGIDLIGPKGWSTLQKNNLISTMCNGAEISLTKGFNHKEYHNRLVDNYLEHIDLVADAGYTNLICFSGNRNGMDDEIL